MNERPTFCVTGLSRRRLLKAAAAATTFGAFSLAPFKRANAAPSTPQGLALCIGLNYVDTKAYRGWRGTLRGCENDAKDMVNLAKSQGFRAMQLLNQQATIANVRSAIAWAANDLQSGDIFMISCSSHGAYRRDSNSDEVDGRDETWCLFDGQWSDDDRYALWTRFARGVRILVVSDNCHSGTTAKARQALEELEFAHLLEAENEEIEREARSLLRSRSVLTEDDTLTPRDITEDLGNSIVDDLKKYQEHLENIAKERGAPRDRDATDIGDETYGERFNAPVPSPIRAMPDQLAEFLSSVEEEKSASPSERSSEAKMRASGLLLAACQDSQTALDGDRNGVFTNALKMTWNSGKFQGTYETFYQSLLHLLRNYPTHQPNRDLFGEGQFNKQRPFQIR